MSLQTVFIRLPAPFEPLHLHVDPETILADLPLPCTPQTYLRTRRSILPLSTRISSLRHADNASHPIDLELGVRLPGGKGGFGSQLRAAGGRMSSGKNNNVDSCRDLSGRRLSTIKEAQRQAELLESAPQLRAQAVAMEKARLEALERTLGLTSDPDAVDNGEGSSKNAAAGSSKAKRIAEVDIEEIAKKRHKFNDNQFFEESREIKDSVRNAVAAGLLKKKKKPTAAADTDDKAKEKASEVKGKEASSVKGKAKEKTDRAMMPPPAVGKAAIAA